jgi:aspartate/methionine/tyrosine aminotransferase/prephenate dehydrogenase/prephenate dehydratase
MKIGYQCIKDCYSYNVIKKYLNNNIETVGYNNFEEIFDNLNNNKIDFAVLPIENSVDESTFVNYDLFYNYNVKIHCEFKYETCDSLHSTNEVVIAHPRAIKRCINNIARFYLISLKKNRMYHEEILNSNLKIIHDKFSGYIITQDKMGILYDYLAKFKENNYNITKIESKPYHCEDRQTFSYICYIEGQYNRNSILSLSETIPSFNLFGEFPILEFDNINSSQINKLKVGIIGFGRFGQFIGEQMVNYGFQVYATSRSNYTDESKKIGVTFLNYDEFIKLNVDVVIIATSILSFEKVVDSYPIDYWEDKLVVDVLSVKVYPSEILSNKLKNCNILLTHPMFGPDSAKFSWKDKNFVYWKNMIDNTCETCITIFLNFWENQGCTMIEMSPQEHDSLTANSQFLTHFIGRTLELLDCNNTLVDTDGYKSLVKIKDHSINDSWDLFYALAKYNPVSIDTINKLKFQINKLEEQILHPKGKKIKESETGKVFSKILQMQSKGINIINSAIGVPSWYPKLENINFEEQMGYSTAKGNLNLITKLLEYYKDKHSIKYINKDNLLITSGAKSALYLALKLLTKVGSKWLVPIPYWTSYPDMIEINNGSTIFINSSVDDNWSLDIDTIEQHFISNGDMVNGIIICQPNNPTGLLYEQSFIEDLINLANKYDKYIIIDEVYLPLTNNITSYAYALTSKYEKLIVVSSFSKYWAVPGWRVGWVLSESKIINNLLKLQSSIFTCAPNSSQEVCYKLLQNNFTPDLSILNQANIELSDIFKSKGWTVPDNKETTMYLFPVNNVVNIDEVVDKLLDNGLGVISGKPFGYNNAIRLTLPNDLDNLLRIKLILLRII